MIRWSLKTLIHDRSSVISTVAGITVSFLMVLLIEGMFNGESRQVVAYPRLAGGDLWMMEKGVANMHMASSFVSRDKAILAAKVEGVGEVKYFLYVNTLVEAGGENWLAYVVGIPGEWSGLGPAKIVSGEPLPASGQAVIPHAMAKKLKLVLGDEVIVSGNPLTISGMSQGLFSMANSVVFVDFHQLEEILGTFDQISYAIINLKPGYHAREVAGRIQEEVGGVDVLDQATFIENDLILGKQMGAELIAIMAVVGGSIAALVAGWMMFMFTVRHYRELAIIKAVGGPFHLLLSAVQMQSFFIVLTGYLLAVALAIALEPVLSYLIPEIAIYFTEFSIARLGAIALVIAVVAAAVPAFRIARVDPVKVFES